MFVSAESRENIEKLSNENDNKTILQHHVSIMYLFFNMILYNMRKLIIIYDYIICRFKLIDYLV